MPQKNNFKGWQCNAGIDGLFVNERGLIASAACLPEERDEHGNIWWLGKLDQIEDFSMPTEPVICPKRSCFCNTDLILSKLKI